MSWLCEDSFLPGVCSRLEAMGVGEGVELELGEQGLRPPDVVAPPLRRLHNL